MIEKSRSETVTVLVSSVGRRSQLIESFRQALSELGVRGRVLGVDAATEMAPAAYLVDRCFAVGRCCDPGFIDDVLKIAIEEDVCLIVPTIDTELLVYAANRQRFLEHGITVAVSAPETVRIACDKVETHRWLVENGFPTPRQGNPDEVLRSPVQWTFPLILKPRLGSASTGVLVVESLVALRELTEGRQGMIVQEIARGNEYTVNMFVQDGRCVCAVPHRRLETRGGEVSKGITVRDERLMKLVNHDCGAACPGHAARSTFNALWMPMELSRLLKSMQGLVVDSRSPIAPGQSFRCGFLNRCWRCPVQRRMNGRMGFDASLRRRSFRFWSAFFAWVRRASSWYLIWTILSTWNAIMSVAGFAQSENGAPNTWVWKAFRSRLKHCSTKGDAVTFLTLRLTVWALGVMPERSQRWCGYIANMRRNIKLLPDAVECLARLQGRVYLGLLTDGNSISQWAKIDALGLRGRFDATVVTGDWGADFFKPHVKGYQYLESRSEQCRGRFVYVADNPSKDFFAPRTLGWDAIRVRRPGGLHEHQECSSELARFEVPNLEPVPDLVSELYKTQL